jgi:hypothetical protein
MTLAAGAACNPIESPPSPPVNSCPSNPCSAYVQSGPQPTCTSGVCLVTAAATGLVLVVELAETSGFAPGGTFAAPLDEFLAAQQRPIAGCVPPHCASLPSFVSVEGAYLIAPKAATTDVSFPLGNPSYTALPAQATFRLLWPPTSGASGALAEALGLPIEPVQTVSIGPPLTPLPLRFPGPGGGVSLGFSAFLQPGSYEVVLRPTAPFDSVFGPEVTAVTIAPNGSTVALPPSCPSAADAQLQCVEDFDITKETGQGATIPTFDIARADGLDGWTTYLRDSSGTIVSNVVALTGSAPHVVLATDHLATATDDALAGTALIIAPPLGAPYPTAIFAPIGNVLPATETYPTLPAPTVIGGSLSAEDGTPVGANVSFEALAITDENGISNTSNFEFVAEAQALPSGPFGSSTYSIELPQGSYRVSVRPLDPSGQVTTLPLLVVGTQSNPALNVVVGSPRTVSGAARVADGRPLSDAEIDAQPVACTSGNSPACLPRQAITTAAADGSFRLALDPGRYLLSVHPADGTGLPWTSRPLSVGAADAPAILAPIAVPAPVAAGLKLLDPTGSPVAGAQVRFFSMSAGGLAVEVGRAVSGRDGNFEMYLQPLAQ